MALDIPMPESSGESLLKGLNTGSDLIHKMMLNKYYGQLHPSGDVANALYVEQLRNQYGDDDPRYIQAKRAHDLALQGRESLIGYRDILNQTAGIRATSPLGKLIAEGKGKGAQDVLDRGKRGGNDNAYAYDDNGNNVVATPGEVDRTANGSGADNNPRTPEERETYERKINQETGDADARKRMRFGENLDITRKAINRDDLTRYSGPKGLLKKIGEALKAFGGNPSKEYTDYSKSAYQTGLMVKQMRQFYSESIQEPAMKKLEALANPSSPFVDPKIAKVQLDSLNKILDQETATYKKYGTSPIKFHGIDYDEKSGKFVLGNNKKPNQKESDRNADNIGKNDEGGSYDLSVVIPQLMKINPDSTEENIRATAKRHKTTIDNVINQLFQRSVRRQ